MSVAEWMTRDPVVASAETPLEEGLATMIRHRIRHLPIVDEQGFVGILSAPSLIQRRGNGASLDPELARSPLRVHGQYVEPLSGGDSVDVAIKGLESHSCLPVLEGTKLIGLFSYYNLLTYFMRNLAPQRVRRGGATPAPHRLDNLVSLVRRVSQAGDVEAILEAVMVSLRPIMPVDQAFILFLTPESDVLKVAASYMSPQAQGPAIEEIPLRDTLSGYVCLHQRSLRVDDLKQERRFPHSQDLLLTTEPQVELRSVMAVPLLDQHTPFGVLQFWSVKPYAYLDSDLELLELAAGYIASMIQRSWRLEKEQELVQQLQRANRIKDEFLAVVTHDLRNTLQGVLSYSQLLARKVTEPRLQMMARGIVESARHMSNLTNDLHDLARLGMEAMRVEPQLCQVAHIAEQVQVEFADFAEQENVQLLQPEIPEGLSCRADPVRLRQVLSNLVSNAIKYNRPQGTVQMKGKSVPGGVQIEVVDTGIGIPHADQETIFDLFTRAANHRRLDSSGLGLAISKRLVELHGGTLTLQSEPEQGSCFMLYLPDSPEIQS